MTLPAYRSAVTARAARFPLVSFSLTALFSSLSILLPFYRATHPLCHYCRGTVNPLPLVRLSLLVSPPLCSLSLFSVFSAGCFLNKKIANNIVRKFLCSRHSRVHLQINRTVNNDIVGHIVTAVECESQLPASIQDIHSCFWKKNPHR